MTISLYLPHEDAAEYQLQQPLELTGRVVWQKADGDSFHCGLAYDSFDDAKRHQIEKCFAYFGKNSRYQEFAAPPVERKAG